MGNLLDRFRRGDADPNPGDKLKIKTGSRVKTKIHHYFVVLYFFEISYKICEIFIGNLILKIVVKLFTPWIWIRNQIQRQLDPDQDPHYNVCGSETI